MFDDIRRVGEKIDNVLGTDIFPFNYPFSHTENFLQHLEKWEFAIPLKFLWFVHIETIPEYVNSQNMWNNEPGEAGQHSGVLRVDGDEPAGSTSNVWDINQGRAEITKETFMDTGGKYGCILAQGVVLPGDSFTVEDLPINNNMGFLPGKIGGNRAGTQELTIQFRETNRSFPDLVIRPWIQLASHLGLVARPPTDNKRNIKTNISIVQLAKTYQYLPLIERKVWHFYNCVPVGINGAELTYDGNEIKLYDVRWQYTHYGIESLPNQDMGKYMSKEGFKKFVKDTADRLLSKNRFYRKLKKKLASVERFVDKAAKIKKKIDKVVGFLGGLGKTPTEPGGNRNRTTSRGRTATGSFVSDDN